ncbi:MAG TPA: O-antigen ligase family protein [Tepidisphaeraceae bacterium]|jgi:hypothetical protein|nr:O-antigen ligase family protein [Tepidisphaeraceae bacterium]
MNNAQEQLDNLIGALANPATWLLVLLGLVVCVVLGFSRSAKWAVVAGLLFISNLDTSSWIKNQTLVTPLPLLLSFARALAFGSLLLLLVPTLMSDRGWRRSFVPAAAVFFLLCEMMLTLRIAADGNHQKSTLGFVLFPLTFIILIVGIGRHLQSVRGAERLITAITAGGAMVLLATVIQVLVNSQAVVHRGRLAGLTSSPNHSAVIFALLLIPTAHLITRQGVGLKYRLSMIGIGGLASAMLLWTGSRTGALMAAVGLVMYFRHRIDKLFIVAAAVGISLFAAMQVFSDSSESAERMLDTSDTRSHVWQAMFRNFASNPFFGVGEQTRYSENSFLLVASQAGLLALVPLIIFVFLMVYSVIRMLRLRAFMDRDLRATSDFVLASVCALGAGACFEGYFTAFFSFPLYYLYLQFPLLAFVIDAAQARATSNDVGFDQPFELAQQLEYPWVDNAIPR